MTPRPTPTEQTPEYLSQADAAELAGVSLDTIKRDRRTGRYPAARREDGPNGAWQIPVADLVAAGRLDAEQVPAGGAGATARQARLERDTAILRAEIEHLRTALAKAEEQLAEERRSAATAREQVVTLAGRIADLTQAAA